METANSVHLIPMKEIKGVSKFNVRLTDRDKGIDDLAKSIKEFGLLQPVILGGTHGSPPYELIAGGRRYRAYELLARNKIRAVFTGQISDVRAKLLSLSENMHRVELNDADKAEAITSLYLHYKKDDKKVAKKLGLPLRTVRDYIKIEERATSKAKRLLRAGKVRKADVKRVIDAAQGNDNKADRLLDLIPGLSRYEKDRAVQYGKNHTKASAQNIVDEGKKPGMVPIIILNIPEELDTALKQAANKLSMAKESVAVRALSEWLATKGYLKSG